MLTRLALLLASAISTMAMAAVRSTVASETAGAVRSRENRFALQDRAKRSASFSERRGGSRHIGGKGPLVAILPAPLSPPSFLPTLNLVARSETLGELRSFHPRLSRGPPPLLS